MDLVKLNREEIRKAIEEGDNCQGRRWLAVRPNGDVAIHWADTNRPWDPWADDAQVIGLSSLYPEGEGTEAEDAQECLREHLGPGKAKAKEDRLDEDDVSIVEYAEEHYPDWMEACRDNQLEWLLEAFLNACNGDGADLKDMAPWGMTGDGDYGEVVKPPFEFEWAE